MTSDLEGLIKHLGWSSASTLAHSWSAKLLTIWATKHPERFRSLILVDPFLSARLPSWLTITLPTLYRVLPFLKMMRTFTNYEIEVLLEAIALVATQQYRQVNINQPHKC